jgi:hypothetical protein
MSIRCANCRALVSEWAGWCQGCGHSLDGPDAVFVADEALRARQRAATPSPSSGALGVSGAPLPRPSPAFARMVPLGPARLAASIEAWWTTGSRAGFVTVRGRLRLGPPTVDASTRWTMTGRFWQSTPLHAVPVVLELWPLYEGYARMTLTPRGHVIASRRYFRVGHSVLDRLSKDLARATTGA